MSDTARLYRESTWLVVPRNASNFEERCWWSNEPTGGMMRDVDIVDPAGNWQFGFTYGFRIQQLKDKVRIPCTAAWKANNKGKKLLLRRRFLAVCLPIMFLSAVFLVSMILLLSEQELKETPATIAAFSSVGVFTFAMIGAVIGLALPYLEDGPGAESSMVVGLINDTHYWIAGAHPDFLAQLPAWEGPTRDEQLAQRKGFFAVLSESWSVVVVWAGVSSLAIFIAVLIKYSLKQAILK